MTSNEKINNNEYDVKIEKDKKTNISISINENIANHVKEYAKKHKKSVSNSVEFMIEEFLIKKNNVYKNNKKHII